MLPILAVLAVAIGVSLAWLYRQQRVQMAERARAETVLVTEVTKASLRSQMLRNSNNMLQTTVELIGEKGQFAALELLSKDGVIRYSTDLNRVGTQLTPEHPTCSACHSNVASERPGTIELDGGAGGRVLRSMSLIENESTCRACHSEDDGHLGILVLDRSLDRDLLGIGRMQGSLLAIGIGSLLVIAGLSFLILQRLVLRPVDALIEGTRDIRRKNFDARIEVGVDGELGELGEAFNAMVADTRDHVTEIERKSFELSALYSIVERVTRTIDLDHLRRIILDIVGEAFSNVETAAIAIRAGDGGEIHVGVREVGEGAASSVRMSIDEVPQTGARGPIDAVLLQSWLAGEIDSRLMSSSGDRVDLPMRPNGRDVGLLSIVKVPGNCFEEAELHLLDALQAHVSVALENARLYTMAITDELTRLYTLRYFQHSLDEEVNRYQRYGQKLALLMIDVDDFKRINDTYGHPVGDEALRRIARLLKESVRNVDIACRYGGEEFAAILPSADRKAAHVVAERIRAAVEGTPFDLVPGRAIRLTVSVGAACCPANALTTRDLVSRADEALYQAKRDGKNRVAEAAPARLRPVEDPAKSA